MLMCVMSECISDCSAGVLYVCCEYAVLTMIDVVVRMYCALIILITSSSTVLVSYTVSYMCTEVFPSSLRYRTGCTWRRYCRGQSELSTYWLLIPPTEPSSTLSTVHRCLSG